MSSCNINVEFGKCSLLKDELIIPIKTASLSPSEYQRISTGSLYFGEHSIDGKHIPFMLAPYTADAEAVTRILFDEWNLPLPKIILFVVAETGDSPPSEYRELSRKLVKGLLYALKTTEMWFCTDGLNYGFSRDISNAIENEISRKSLESGMKHSGFPEISLIGICQKDDLNFSQKFGMSTLNLVDNVWEKQNEHGMKNDINRSYGYFIIVDDTTETKKGMSKFMLHFMDYINTLSKSKPHEMPESSKNPQIKRIETPIMTILLHGTFSQIDLILGHLKLGLPLVIIEGSGGLADLLAFAYCQTNYRPKGSNIAEYTESVLKPQVSHKMKELYPDFSDYKISNFTEKIFGCIRYSKQPDQEFITVLNLNSAEYHPSRLSVYLLKAFFKSQTLVKVKDVKRMKKDLFLAMDWNSADVAREEVFARDPNNMFQIDGEMFYKALTELHREDFVSLFIKQGFMVHTYLDSSNLLQLFENSLHQEFFRSIIWESVLGFGANIQISRNFLDINLIILLEELTGIPSLFSSYELDWNSRAIYEDRTPAEAERKAMAVIVFWAILSYRVRLVKALWRYSEQPIHIALVCSIILRKLTAYVADLSLKHEMEKQSKEFSIMAVSVMTMCNETVPCRALDLLKEKNRVWSYRALMELAAFSKNKMFISHPCCQKYLDNMFMGCIKIRDLPYGDITIPLWLKIVFSSFLIFPMYLWARFEPIENNKQIDDKFTIQSSENGSSKGSKSNEFGFFRKIYYFWSAPITKFWVSQVFYLLFLICFSLAVIWPSCGNIILDFFTCVWIATFILDSMYHAYMLNIKYTSMSLVNKCLEISLMILFLFCYVMGRIVWKQTFMRPYYAKVMLCIALLYCYYRLIFIALPISPELGPMLYRVKRMTTVDFVTYMKVTGLVLISNGIVLHAVVYPDFPLSWELARRAFFDAIITFFLVYFNQNGIPDPKCIRLKRAPDKISFIGYPTDVCKVGRYYKYDCPNPGVWPYIFGIQYVIILRLILVVTLFALFSNTTRKLEEEGKYIWKYQRYGLVINFSNRLTLPPPLCIISLLYMIGKYAYKNAYNFAAKHIFRYSKIRHFRKRGESSPSEKLDEDDFRYWKSLAEQYCLQKKQQKAEKITIKERMEGIDALADAFNKQRRTLKDLEGHLSQLKLEIVNAHQYLEGSGLQVSMKERLQAVNVPQIFSRISPYPNTMISRFPVSDNHVSWQCIFPSYDPIAFTLPKDDFPHSLQPHVDIDIQRKRENEGEDFRMPLFNWNELTISPGGVYLDRQSWIIDKKNQLFRYELDSEELPKNPVGRTGLKGRGCLLRWGPNHYIYVVITQWHGKGEMVFDKYLEIILLNLDGNLCLPGGYVYTENRYEVIRSLFHCQELWKTSKDMIAYFESLVEVTLKRFSFFQTHGKESDHEVLSERIKLGYLDDEKNTDQAWCEAEIWHFHYNCASKTEDKFKADMQWYLLSEESLLTIPIGQAAIVHSIAKKMKAILEVM